ncbi:MAG TPA: AAA family ATPase [Thermoleophilaceae bacterium]
MSVDVIERSEERAAIESFLDALVDGPAALIFEGDPGIGKTTLLRSAIESARMRGNMVLSCEAGSSETRLSYSALADLMDGIDRDVVAGLPEPQRDALDAALLRSGAGAHDADPRAVAMAVLSVLERLAEEQPLMVAIDDLQWLDRPSARVVEFCARRVAGSIGILVSRRSSGEGAGAPGQIELRQPERIDVRRLAPFEPGALQRLLRERTEQPLARVATERIHEASGGNPFFALELLDALPPGGKPLAPLPIPSNLQEIVEARLAGLGPELEEILLAVAVLAAPTVELIVQAFGPEADALLDTAEDRRLLERDGRRLRFAHPLLAGGIHARVSPSTWRDMHRRMSAVVPDIEERARHLAYANAASEAVPVLDEAARYVRARGAPAAAAELLELALELGGSGDLRVRAAEHHFDAGDSVRAQELLGKAIPLLPGGGPRADALRLLAEIRYHADSYPEARALLEKACAEQGVDQRLRVMLDLRLAFVLCNLGQVAAAEGLAWSALTGAETLDDDALRAQGLALSATVDFALGLGIHEARLARALQLESPDVRTPNMLRPSRVAAFLYLWTGRLDTARPLLEALSDWHAERGEDHELAWNCSSMVWLECWAGNLEAAAMAADEASERLLQLGTRNSRALSQAGQAHVAAYAGRADEARLNAEEALDLFRRSGWQTASWRPLSTLGMLELSLGDPEAAAEILGATALGTAASGLVSPVTWGGGLSYGDAAEALVGVGKIEEAETIVAMLERHGYAWQRGVGARCRGLILGAGGDFPAAEQMLEYAVTSHERLQVPLERGRSLLLLGRIQRRRRKALAAKETLEQALRIFESIGSPLWAEQARAELAEIVLPKSGPDGLTKSEELTARLAASGLTNREVAAAMHVSPKTVEVHLGRAYRKLGIKSRAELGAHMALKEASEGSDRSGTIA